MQLKALTLPTVVQSPMANCSDLAFRLIARSQGMRFAFLEMVSSEALVRNVRGTEELLRTVPEDRPLGAQLVGCDADVMGEAAAKLEALGFDLVDLNLGCPVPKVVSTGGGSKLLREPATAERIFRRVVRSVRRVPVTVKMRLGYNDATGGEAARIAQLAEASGVDAVAVHGRTRAQGYAGQADYEAIRRVKEAVAIPVIGNGDVVDADSALRLRATAGCDGVMIARGALGNPWIYGEVEAALSGAALPSAPTWAQRLAVVLRHIELQCRYDARPEGPLRRIICWYFKERPGVADFRNRIHLAQTVAEMQAAVLEFAHRTAPDTGSGIPAQGFMRDGAHFPAVEPAGK